MGVPLLITGFDIAVDHRVAIGGEPVVAFAEATMASHSASVAGGVSTGAPPRGQDRAVLIRRVLEARFGNASSDPKYILQLLQLDAT